MPRSLIAKTRGEWAEVCFLREAIRRGFIVSKPYGDTARYDCIVDGGGERWRVQVKSTWYQHDGIFVVNSSGGRRRGQGRHSYTRHDIDFLAVYIVPRRVWYIVPVDAFTPRTALSFCPPEPRRSPQWEPFRNAWHLLRSPRMGTGGGLR